VTFEVGTDVDKATFDVNNRVQLATPRLPDEVRRQGVTVAKRSNNFLLVMALMSPKATYDQIYISNYATQNDVDDLKRVPGVADVFIFGARDYSMRLWLQPDRMARLGVTTKDIQTAVNAQNAQFAAGQDRAEPSPRGSRSSTR
jgi:multidrug efflux pump subunit AcrB